MKIRLFLLIIDITSWNMITETFGGAKISFSVTREISGCSSCFPIGEIPQFTRVFKLICIEGVSVAGCYKASAAHFNSSGLSLFSLPKDPETRRQWLEAIGVREADFHNQGRVCSLHFTRDSFTNMSAVEFGFPKKLARSSSRVNKAISWRYSC